jgi:hypothetical protein
MKDHYSSFVFPATCSLSFVIPATLSTSPQHHQDGLFSQVPSLWIGTKMEIPLLSHLKYPIFGGVFEKNVV